jgi:hypothetical protein
VSDVPKLPRRVAEHIANALIDQLRQERPGHIIELVRHDEGDALFTCPRCGMTSAHPTDVQQGYCGNCHDWTAKEQAG